MARPIFNKVFVQICRCYSHKINVKKCDPNADISKIRNIGILAHIDAGKTTTTERMLFYSGTIRSMGEVHHGNTVTDYMEQERMRGITITSAAVTFLWRGHKFNLIDTPGHIDFTVEVERTLNVMDGAVVILDGSAGVEAQTLTVWRQTDRYQLPRIVYVNKMDRKDANLNMCLESLQSKLEVIPLPIQLPHYNSDNKLCGLVNLVTLTYMVWATKDEGRTISSSPLDSSHGILYDDAIKARANLTEKLADIDDCLAEKIIECESIEKIESDLIVTALQRAALSQRAVPVVCGSSYKNIGVQPLMDAVIHYLPSPQGSNKKLSYCFGDSLCARAFKVIHDDHKKPLTFIRIYTGTLKKGQRIYNIQKEQIEQCSKLVVMYADETSDVDEISTGNIAAVGGLKYTVTGDFITSTASVAATAKKRLGLYKPTSCNPDFQDFGLPTDVPDPVFFCSIEPPSQAYQNALDNALIELQREDPSLHVSQNAETGQTVLGGMGELHIEIIKNRILTEYKIDADLGPLQIAYKETIKLAAKDTHSLNHRVGSTKHEVTVTLSVIPCLENNDQILKFDKTKECAANIAAIHPRYMNSIKQGVLAGLQNGPKLSCPVINVNVMLHWMEISRGTSETMVSAAVTQCISKILHHNETLLLEPLMNLEIVANKGDMTFVINDLSQRRAVIKEVSHRGLNQVVEASVPLSELCGYSTDLRTITSGTATFAMEFQSYVPMSAIVEAKAIKDITGLYPETTG